MVNHAPHHVATDAVAPRSDHLPTVFAKAVFRLKRSPLARRGFCEGVPQPEAGGRKLEASDKRQRASVSIGVHPWFMAFGWRLEACGRKLEASDKRQRASVSIGVHPAGAGQVLWFMAFGWRLEACGRRLVAGGQKLEATSPAAVRSLPVSLPHSTTTFAPLTHRPSTTKCTW